MKIKVTIRILTVLFIYLGSFFAGNIQAIPLFQQVSSESDTQYVNKLLSEAYEDINQGQFSAARSKIKQADHLSDSLDYMEGNALSIVRLADMYLNQQKNDSVIVLLNNAIESYPESDRLIDFYNFLATAFQYKGENLHAIENYQKALELVPDIPAEEQARTTAGVRLNLAGVYLAQGDREQAFENYLTALRFSEMTQDTVFWATTLNNIGNAYNQVESFEESVFYLEKAKEIAEEKNLKNELYRINLNLANSKSNQEKYKEAIDLYNTALELHEEIRPDTQPVVVLYNLGRMHGKQGMVEEAEHYFETSLKYSQDNGIIQGLYYNNLGYGELYYNQERYEEAIQHLLTAHQIALDVQSVPFLHETREKLYLAYRDANQYQNALTYLELYKETADSLFDRQKEQDLANLENQLALDRQSEINRLLQEKQVQQERKLYFQLILIITAAIALVLGLLILVMMKRRAAETEQITQTLHKQKAELEELNKAKDKVFAIIAHDLRSPLASMQSLLYLIKENSLSKEEMHELAKELEVSVQQNVDAMEDLLAWANEQLSGVKIEVQGINVKAVVDEIFSKQAFLASKKQIELINQVDEHIKVMADYNALQLVLRNLISNSIKFTPNGGQIIVSGNENQQVVHLKVQDTGIGIPADVIHKVFEGKSWTRAGTNNEKGTGFGLSLTKEFIEKMNGSIRFESEENKGTTFFIDLHKA